MNAAQNEVSPNEYQVVFDKRPHPKKRGEYTTTKTRILLNEGYFVREKDMVYGQRYGDYEVDAAGNISLSLTYTTDPDLPFEDDHGGRHELFTDRIASVSNPDDAFNAYVGLKQNLDVNGP